MDEIKLNDDVIEQIKDFDIWDYVKNVTRLR
jgi:hypothetical protein